MGAARGCPGRPGIGPSLLLMAAFVLSVVAAAAASEKELSNPAALPAIHPSPRASTLQGPAETPFEETRLHVFTLDYPHVQIPFEITLWILLASLAKIGK